MVLVIILIIIFFIKTFLKVGEEMSNYSYQFSVFGIKFYINYNDGQWYFRRKNNKMHRLM